ncbi:MULTISPECIES: SAF domain-containing protein [Paenibacillus]|uniref:SAF domain-containing protein n=1 Tax=Paenibacillus TaxID=44249 RepID=UPI00119F00E7|nr:MULTISPECIES: SAF domain-containing protein [unclassified Paenibacillus]
MSWTYRHRKTLIIAAIAVSVCLLAAAAIYSLIKQSEQEQKQQQMKEHYERQIEELKTIEEQSRRSVWTVARTVPAGGTVKAEDLKSVPMPANLVPQGMITDQNAVIGKSAKIELQPGTPLMPSMLYESAPIPKDLRVQEFHVIQLPSNLQKGQYIDVRINFPTGEDFVLLAKKKARELSGNVIWLEMNEMDILRTSSAIIDAYLQGARLYALPYIEPGLQESAVVNYPANPKVLDLMEHDPNLLEKATTELARQLRTTLDDNLKAMSESDKLRVTSGSVTVQQQLQNERIVTQQGNAMHEATPSPPPAGATATVDQEPLAAQPLTSPSVPTTTNENRPETSAESTPSVSTDPAPASPSGEPAKVDKLEQIFNQ